MHHSEKNASVEREIVNCEYECDLIIGQFGDLHRWSHSQGRLSGNEIGEKWIQWSELLREAWSGVYGLPRWGFIQYSSELDQDFKCKNETIRMLGCSSGNESVKDGLELGERPWTQKSRGISRSLITQGKKMVQEEKITQREIIDRKTRGCCSPSGSVLIIELRWRCEVHCSRPTTIPWMLRWY